MRHVLVRRLSLRVPSGHLAASRQRVEDGLFLAATDETRLVLLRRLDLGRMSSREPASAWAERAAERLSEQRARAVHASQPAAEAADAVWFRSTDEARELLLLLLAAGRRPAAWFWRLAVPEWRELSLPQWLEVRVAAALADPAGEVALARAIIAAAREGELPAVARALASATLSAMPAAVRPALTGSATFLPREIAPLVSRLIGRLEAGIAHAIFRVLADLPAQGLPARWLVRLTLVAAAPELAGHHTTLAELTDRVVADARPGAPLAMNTVSTEADRPLGAIREATDRDARAQARDPLLQPLRQPTPRDAPQPFAPCVSHGHGIPPFMAGEQHPPPRARDAASAEPLSEHASRGAGVLLAIRALDHLGLGARLAGDPEAAASGFGRHLLRHLAAHARVPPEDALFALLTAPDSPPHPNALRLWRVGLDRWLRRRVRLRLGDLARTRGWLHQADTTLVVRFPLDAADVRLRRLALDSDPGWVPWLGLTVRYQYQDAPLRW
jgi:hypothetical protein